MPDPFHSHIRTALANPGLQAALDANAERRQEVRLQSYASLPEDIQAMRRRAHRVRANTIANLDAYLEAFISKAEANGLIVHRASDAAQAVDMVLETASRTGARVIAKSKTMVGEEIHLNPALEKAGLKVVETDLGEFIVQLRGEPPAHIITPAVHLSRKDVGQTFHEKLGIALTDDISTLTSVARSILRQTFLNAEIGISGVNFGVVESGTLCLITNEGNGRMVTTLPPVHIALMGIERLVPSFDDLALLLALLPRSATGQKLTVYTSLIHSPRREDEADGPRERHLILVDNGRTAIRRSKLVESLYCIRCGACLNACPVFQELGGHAYVGSKGEGTSYAGPIGAVISPGLFGQSEFGNLARASSLCGACKEACPVDIDLPKLLLRIRAGGTQTGAQNRQLSSPSHVPPGLSWALRVYSWLATDPRRFNAAQRLAAIFGRLGAPFSPWLRLPAFTGWGYSRDFPRPAAQPFRFRFNHIARETTQDLPAVKPAGQPNRLEVALADKPLPSEAQEDLTERFANELMALGGYVARCRPAQAAESVLALLRERNVHSVLAWEGQHLPAGILEALQAAGMRVTHQPDPETQAGLTGALAAVSETGTLVLPGGPGRPLSASLLPEIHVALLKCSDIYASLAQVLHLQEVREAASVALVSGPSRTADIEMTLTIGVHGPREVCVFCLD
jgi:L-lactate dehydrogenase complex protein LldF